MRIKGCIFDLDGVIVDTAKYHYLAWKRLALDLGFDFMPEQNERLKGVSRVESLKILLEIGGVSLDDATFSYMMDKKNAWYVEYISKMEPDEILPYVLDFLNELKAANIKIALGSASKNAMRILKQIKLDHYFDAIVDGTKVTHAKPDPEVFLVGARELNCDPKVCVVFEDAVAGVEAAKAGGMFCVGIGDANVLAKADVVIQTFEQMDLSRLQEVVV